MFYFIVHLCKRYHNKTDIKTGSIPFYIYVGNIALEENENKLKEFFESNGLTVLNLTRIQTKSITSKAFKLTIPKSQIDIIGNSELWPIGMILNKYTFPKLQYSNQNKN